MQEVSITRVLVACEFSGVVRDAFRALGHDAWSCDIVEGEGGVEHHIQADVREVIGMREWDLMIAHPPCTYLCSSGLHWNKRVPGRDALTEEALGFVRDLLGAPIPLIALENPVGRISTAICKPDQIIQPWMFGDDASKATCLWLKNLPRLQPTASMVRPAWIVCDCCGDMWCQRHGKHAADCECPDIDAWALSDDSPYRSHYANQTPSKQNKLGPSRKRAAERSRTYAGIAQAMAEQWGSLGAPVRKKVAPGADLPGQLKLFA